METLTASQTQDFAAMDLPELADFIVATHHEYLAKNLPILWELAQKIAHKHAQKYPELLEIADMMEHFVTDLPAHLAREEKLVFPYVHKLTEVRKHHNFDDLPPFQFLHNPINHAESEHDDDLLALEKIKQLTHNFTPPEDACENHRLAYAKLAEFYADMHQHIYLENQVLFPKAIELQKSLWLE
ncbi:MAG: hemerythrin domain-containing protein [Microscillaceae bacterium]|jgi:regulator of cell morphogenesis and NO signaling|nr:hemerythrin domain-containing protein [Microscillaceae bacterium]